MKLNIVNALLMGYLCLLFVSCNKEETYMAELNSFQEELATNSEIYTLEEWENAEAMLTAFKADAVDLKLSNVQKQKALQAFQACEQSMALHAVCKLKELTQKIKAGYLDFSKKQWEAARSSYSEILAKIDPKRYTEEQVEEINFLLETCTLVFSMQPILELQELCRYISENDSIIDYNHRDQLKVKYLNICVQLQEYEYSTELHWKIDKLQELFDNYWEHTRWSSVKNTVNAHIQEMLDMIEK